MNLPPPLRRSLTIHKIDVVTQMIENINLKSTTALIELLHVKDNTWLAYYYDIDEDGKKVLEQKYISGNDYKELKCQFGVSLLSD